MTYTPLTYPNNLTKAYWDKKKGLLGKAAGETGIGDAAKKAESLFDKIDWEVFDVLSRTPTAASAKALDNIMELKKDIVAEHKKTVTPAIEAIKDLAKVAGTAAPELKKKKFTDSAKAAEEIAKGADIYYGSLQLNGVFFTNVYKEWEVSRSTCANILDKRKEVMKQTMQFIVLLIKGLDVVRKSDAPTAALWDKEAKQAGRSVSNNLKGNPELAKKHLKTWTTKFKGFDWGSLGFAKIDDPAELKKALNAIFTEVAAESKLLQADLAA